MQAREKPKSCYMQWKEQKVLFHSFFLTKEKSFKREWNMAAIWQLSPEVAIAVAKAASMVFCVCFYSAKRESTSRLNIYCTFWHRHLVLLENSIPRETCCIPYTVEASIYSRKQVTYLIMSWNNGSGRRRGRKAVSRHIIPYVSAKCNLDGATAFYLWGWGLNDLCHQWHTLWDVGH